MRKALVFILLFFSLACGFASSIDHVYNNSISSTSFSVVPKRGQLFSDGSGNVFAVKSANEEVVVFDSIYSKNKVKSGSELSPVNPMMKIRACVTTNSAGADFSMIVPLIYPLEPFIDISYVFSQKVSAMVGMKITCPLANLSSSSFTLVKKGSLNGYAAFGLSGNESFGMICGFEYNHIIGNIIWGLGGQMSYSLANSNSVIVPKATLGVFL